MINNCIDSTKLPGSLLQFNIIIGVILTCLTATPVQADDCIKQVFNRYCLGGNVDESLSQIKPTPEPEPLENNFTKYSFKDNGKVINLIANEGIVQTVIRQETPGDWISYTAWKVKLIRLYGRGEDLSSFPPYASSRSSRLNAINAGRGSAEYLWDEEGYQIALVWDTPDYLELRYLLKQDKKATLQNSEGL